MFKNFSQNSFKNFPKLCSSLLPICLHYALRLATFLTILLEHLAVNAPLEYFTTIKVTVLLENINLKSSYVQCIIKSVPLHFAVFTDCSIRKYPSIFMKLSSIV